MARRLHNWSAEIMMTTTACTTDREPGLDKIAADLAGRYAIDRLVAVGGMGRVFEARRVADGKKVAIKVLKSRLARDQRCRKLMLREAHALQVAEHPHVVKLFEHGETRSGLPYLVLEWLDGRTLHSLIAEEAPLTPGRVERIFASLVETLEALHTRGVVHADLKPENVMLVRSPDGREEVVLLDFGVSSVGTEHFAFPGEVCGTPGYLAPEILCGAAPSSTSDLYAATIMLFEMLTARQPFRGTSPAALLLEQMYEPAPRPSKHWGTSSGPWDALFQRALAAEPTERFLDAPSLRAAFFLALVKAPPRPTAQPPCRPWIAAGVNGEATTAKWNPLVGLRGPTPGTDTWQAMREGVAA
jgi:serine/threonine protein kinase